MSDLAIGNALKLAIRDMYDFGLLIKADDKEEYSASENLRMQLMRSQWPDLAEFMPQEIAVVSDIETGIELFSESDTNSNVEA